MTKLTRYLPALLLAGAAIGATACAAGIYDNGYPPRRRYPVYRGASRAAEIGYRDGIEAGRNDARHRDRFDPVRARRYRAATTTTTAATARATSTSATIARRSSRATARLRTRGSGGVTDRIIGWIIG